MNARDLNLRLIEKIEDVCEYLLPDGKKQRNEWVCGSAHGGSGSSFGVKLTGDRAGYWNDLNPSEDSSGKSLVSLWRKVRGVDWKQANDEIREYLNLPSFEPQEKNRLSPKKYTKPDRKKLRNFKEGSKALEYLVLDRCIGKATIEKASKCVCATKEDNAVSFLHRDSDGEICYVNNLLLKRGDNGEKKMFAQLGGKLTLFGKETVREDAEELIICEGQIDQLSWLQYGFDCVSVPNGAKNDSWIEDDWEWLKRFTRIYLAFDADSAGDAGFHKIAQRIGMERCWRIDYSTNGSTYKDANDALMGGEEDLHYLLEAAEEVKPKEIIGATEMRDQVWDTFFGLEKDEPGIPYPLPFPSKVPTNYGSVILFTGFTKHGKTAFLWQICSYLLAQGKKGFIASFEIDKVKAVHFLMRSGFAGKPSSTEEFDKAMDKYMSNVLLFDKFGSVGWKHLIETMKFAHAKYGTFFFVIDSLMRLNVDNMDAKSTREFMNALCEFSMETGAHVFLVAHARKGMADKGKDAMGKPPSADMVRGVGEISDNVFAQFCVWRNKNKETKRDDGGTDTSWIELPDAIIDLQFQRYFSGETRSLKLNFSADACQFYLQKDSPKRYFELD